VPYSIPSILAARFTSDESALRQLATFFGELFDGRITGSDCVVWGSLLLGVTCGVLGAFIVLRRQSLLGDAIGHAVLPGVLVGFWVSWLTTGSGRSTPAMLAGAMVAGLAAAGLISLLRQTTVLKSAEAMGVVFTGFYGIGIVLLKMLQHTPAGGQAGLEKFLFGQIAGISLADVQLMAVIAAVALACVVVFWRKLAVSTFDEQFAQSVGIPVRLIHYLLTALLTVTIVISIQAVGVVLVSAMLITPAATAYLLTDRLHRMAFLSGAFGAAAGFAGAVLSLLGSDLPTGAFMVLAASGLFAVAFLFSPRHGLLPRVKRLWEKRRRTGAENLLRTMYLILERRETPTDRRFGVRDIAAIRHESVHHVRRLAKLATGYGWVERDSPDPIVLTDAGVATAKQVVRNHRLWELFLTQEANLAADHVHADAEYIEHVLPRDVLQKLEQMLDHPAVDPHGQPIP
jgi:manganese/zinc/iron transport system permease protein